MCAKKKAASRVVKKRKPSGDGTTTATKSKTRQRGPAQTKKATALVAAARVLSAAGRPMTTRELIETMAAKGLWTSPQGKTPASTLFSALMREINVKGKESRFVKSERGKFAAKA